MARAGFERERFWAAEGEAEEAAEEVKAETAPALEPTIKRESLDSQQQQQPTCVRSAKRRAVWAKGGAGDDPRARVVAEEAAS